MLTEKNRLELLGLPLLEDLADFSRVTHLSKGLLYRLSKFPEMHYLVYPIPKTSGGFREISQPSKELKAVQAWILRSILDRLKVHNSCKGFEQKANLKDNLFPHTGALIVMCVDLENFFPTIKYSRVWGIFHSLGYNAFVSSILSRLCTFKGGLPQGSPTSPKLANLACYRLDRRLAGYAGSKGIAYTRYADDLTFSGNSYSRTSQAVSFVRKIVESEGFKFNEKKTRIMGPSTRRKVTGLVLASDTFGIGRNLLHQFRPRFHKLSKVKKEVPDKKEVVFLKGWLAYIYDVDQARFQILKNYIIKLQVSNPGSALEFF